MNQLYKDFHLLKERDFGEVLNDSINFIKIYGRPLYKALVYMVLPISLLYGIFSGLFSAKNNDLFIKIFEGAFNANLFEMLFSSSYIGIIFLALVESLLITSLVYSFFKLKLDGEEEFAVSTIWEHSKKHIFRVFGTIVLSGVIFVVIVWFLMLLSGLLIAGMTAISGGAFLVFILSILLFFAMGVIGTMLSMAVPVSVIEGKGALASIRRSISLVSPHWGQTLVIIVVVYVVIGIVSIVFSAPAMIIQWVATINSVQGLSEPSSPFMSAVTVLASCLSTIGNALIAPIVHVCLAIQFFSLLERKEGLGMKRMIDSFGDTEEEDLEEGY